MTNIMTKAIAKIDSQAEKSSNAYMKIIAQHIIDELITDDIAAKKILNENKSLDELMKSIKEKAKKQAEDEKKQAVESAKNEVATEYKESIKLLDKEKAAAVERLNDMEKQAKLTANPVVMKFGFYFDELQKNYNEMAGIIAGADDSTAQKLKGALVNLLQKLSDEAGGQ